MKHPAMSKVVTALAAAALLATGCASSGGSGSDRGGDAPYQVLAIFPLSGAGSAQGNAEASGVKAAVNVLNEHGGMLGRKIELNVQDDQGNSSLAITRVQSELRGSAKPDLVIAGSSSNETDALAPILNREKVLNIQATSDPKIEDGTKTPYTFCSTVSIPSVIDALVTHVKSLNATKIGFVYADDALGNATGQYEISALQKAGINVVSASYSATSPDVSAALLQVKAANPDVLVTESYGAQAGYLYSSRAKIGWNIPTIGDAATAASNLADLVPESNLDNVRLQVFTSQKYVPFAQQPPVRQTFIKAVSSLGPIAQAISSTGFAYDAVMLAHQGAVQAGSADTEAIKKALENLSPAKDSYVVSWPTPKYTAERHVIDAAASDYDFVSASKIVSGFFGVPAGTPQTEITG